MARSWRTAPKPIKLWIALSAAILLVIAMPGLPTLGGPKDTVVGVAWGVLWAVLLLRGSRAAWWILAVMSAVGVLGLLPVAAAGDPPPAGVVVFGALYAASVAALFAPSARAWVGVTRRERS